MILDDILETAHLGRGYLAKNWLNLRFITMLIHVVKCKAINQFLLQIKMTKFVINKVTVISVRKSPNFRACAWPMVSSRYDRRSDLTARQIIINYKFL